MAVAAEQLAQFYYPVEQSPFLAAVRTEARAEAYDIIEQRREQLRNADYAAVPLPVDALSSAQAVVEAQIFYGPASPEAADRYHGLQLDCLRLLAEATRKNTYEYFPPLQQKLDAATGDYQSYGFSIMAMTEAGLSPIAEPEELERRVNERVEEVTYRAIGQLALLGQSLQPEQTSAVTHPQRRRIRTISECPDWAIEAQARSPKAGTGGYVPEIEKFMVRDVSFDPVTGDRYEEQVGLPGLLITGDIIRTVLQAKGVAKAESLSKTELQALQLEADDSLLEFVALLDATASHEAEQPVFMGEPAVADPDYRSLPAAAAERQTQLESLATELANDLLGLERLATDRWAATAIVEARVKAILFSLAEADNSRAATMFDAATARGLQEVSWLRSLGEADLAADRLQQVETAAPSVSYCGAGSCGLEKADVTGGQADTMKEMGLDSSSSLKDTERRCPRCSKKEIVYDLKKKLKACTGCKSTTGFGSK
ncbi:MAG: hypothetical protein QFB87_00920 [Patescibacteria group bacterium]|nr:hypothetical protein [Patescibacteria group bacterium]